MTAPPRTDGLPALLIVCVLAVASVVIGAMGVAPSRVTAEELLGAARDPGETAFVAGHRGGTTAAPENTLPAVREALRAGFEYVEVDLVLTADGHAVLMHDRTVDRTTDGQGPVAALTLDEVRDLDAGSWFSPAFAGTQIPTAEEFLDVLAGSHARAILDLKGTWTPEAAATLVGSLVERDLERVVAVASFDARTLAYVQARSEVVARLISLKKLPSDIARAVRQVGARGILIGRKALEAQPEVIDELHAAGLRVIVYTLNSDTQWGRVTELGVDGIVTDDAGLLYSWQQGLADG